MKNTVDRITSVELDGIRNAVENIKEDLPAALDLLAATRGKVVVVGVGKSGLIGQKIAATFASTGTPSMFLHPVEALHGDLGAIQEQDSVLVISNSGSSREISDLLPQLAKMGNRILGLTGHSESLLSRSATVSLCTGPLQEACPLGLAPTTSTTAALVIGDVLAVLLMERKGFDSDDFADRHPGGSLGREAMNAASLMRTGSGIPLAKPMESFMALATIIDRGKIGTAGIIDKKGILVGVVTDGDLRRKLLIGPQCFELTASDIMGSEPKKVKATASVDSLLERFEKYKVSTLFVVNEDDKPTGIVHLHDVVESIP